eukprot:tig00020563_g11375.t1
MVGAPVPRAVPLAHSFEVAIHFSVLSLGASIAYYSGDTRRVAEELAAAEATVLVGVPRVFHRLYEAATRAAARRNPLLRAAFWGAWGLQSRALRLLGRRLPLVDLPLRPVQARLGGRVRFIASGGAPLPDYLLDFLRVCFPSAFVFEGYGLTETTGAACVTPLGYTGFGSVGRPLEGCEVKLLDVPEISMQFTSEDKPRPRGEVLIRGPLVFRAYRNMPEKTREEKDEEGWFHTGDIGAWRRWRSLGGRGAGRACAASSSPRAFSSNRPPIPRPPPPPLPPPPPRALKLGIAIGAHAGGRGQGMAFTVENGLVTTTMKLRRSELLKRYGPRVDALSRALASRAPAEE